MKKKKNSVTCSLPSNLGGEDKIKVAAKNIGRGVVSSSYLHQLFN